MVVGKKRKILSHGQWRRVSFVRFQSGCVFVALKCFLQFTGVVPLWFSQRAVSEFQVLLEARVPFSAQLLSEEQFECAKQSLCFAFVYS